MVRVEGVSRDGEVRAISNVTFLTLTDRSESTPAPTARATTAAVFDDSLRVQVANVAETSGEVVIVGGSDVRQYELLLYTDRVEFPRRIAIAREMPITTVRLDNLQPGEDSLFS